jgi:hypothetical protein
MRTRVGLATVFLASALVAANATQINGSVGRATGIWTYSDYGNGDVVLTVQNPLPTCQDGFWIRMTDPGAKMLSAQLLSAFHAGTQLHIWANDHEMWTGSAGHYCRIYMARSLAP